MTDPSAYEPPVDLEGPNNGLIEAVADRLWRKRSYVINRGRASFADQTEQVKDGWRKAAAEVLRFLFEIGFVGPAGRPPVEGWRYNWVHECNDWEIVDESGGGVALVLNYQDLPLLLAAPAMKRAIDGFFEELGDEMPDHPTIHALAASVPDIPVEVEETPAPEPTEPTDGE